jgi:ABC-type transporter Mla MlaB component
VRVIGALMGAELETLLEMTKAEVRLDLSHVREVDTDAVQLLAWLALEPWNRVVLPRWLEARIEMERRSWLSAAA